MSVPASFIAGDTVEWTDDYSDYPADDGWTLSYSFRGPSSFSVSGVADGKSFDMTITAASSATYQAGIYSYQAHATKAAERFTVASGQIEIKQNLATVAAGHEARSFARRTLELIENAIESYAERPVESITIGNRTITRPSLSRLVTLRNQFKFIVRDEEAADKVAKGLDSGKKILTRFQ